MPVWKALGPVWQGEGIRNRCPKGRSSGRAFQLPMALRSAIRAVESCPE